jgi:hypothetical protein
MSLETRLRAAIAMSLLSLIILTFFYFQQQDELKKCKVSNDFMQGGDIELEQVKSERDSLRMEIFVLGVEAGRHEITREEVLGKYPKIAKEYNDFYSHQTE